MGYGIQVSNQFGRTVFDTDQPAPNYYFDATPSSVNGYNVDPGFSISSQNILLARTQDNESGVISLESDNAFIGSNSYYRSFGAANGVKYIYGKPQSNRTASTSGYGIEVYKSDGSTVLYSSAVGSNFEILYLGTMEGTTDFTWSMPSGYSFNEIYITAASFSMIYGYSAAVAPFPAVHSVYGNWAYFNAGTSPPTITFRQQYIVTAGNITWNNNSAYSISTSMKRDYLIVARLA